jgi:fumarate hydratase subunit beta
MEFRFTPPISERDVQKLKIGDRVYIEGVLYSWRDRAFERAFKLVKEGKKLPVNLQGAVHWHCGPITKRLQGKWTVASAGSTTSTRFTSAESRAIREWGVRLIVGKGGMGKSAIEAMKECGTAYLAAVGGCAAFYAKKIKKIKAVYWLDLGMPEAIWVYEVENFGPLLVAIDSHGDSLYEKAKKSICRNLKQQYEIMNINPRSSYYWVGGVDINS